MLLVGKHRGQLLHHGLLKYGTSQLTNFFVIPMFKHAIEPLGGQAMSMLIWNHGNVLCKQVPGYLPWSQNLPNLLNWPLLSSIQIFPIISNWIWTWFVHLKPPKQVLCSSFDLQIQMCLHIGFRLNELQMSLVYRPTSNPTWCITLIHCTCGYSDESLRYGNFYGGNIGDNPSSEAHSSYLMESMLWGGIVKWGYPYDPQECQLFKMTGMKWKKITGVAIQYKPKHESDQFYMIGGCVQFLTIRSEVYSH